MAIDYTTPEGQVRLLIADVNDASLILDTAQVTGYLALNGGDVRLAAADALDAIASSEALVSKAIKTQNLTTDGSKTAAALREHATRLRQQAADASDDDFAFDVVYPASRRPELSGYQVWGL
jgi:hypothetical protein